jgi:hypothetical protein
MPSKNRTRAYTLYAFQIPLLILAGLFIFGATYFVETQKEDPAVAGAVLGKENKSNNGGGNSANAHANNGNSNDNSKNGTKTKENAALHRQNITKVVGNLKKVAQDEEMEGNTEVSNQIEEVAQDEEVEADEVTNAIDEVENRPKWKTLLFGTDYKNLGQLRSHLAHNTNSIRKLVGIQTQVSNQENEANVDDQLSTLLEERNRIVGIITDHENDFGLLGWVSRLLTGYVGGGIDQNDLDQYVDVPQTTESSGSLPGTTEPSPTVTE